MTPDRLETLLEHSQGQTRAERVGAAMRSLELVTSEAGVLLAELICEATAQRYHLTARTESGAKYTSSAAYFMDLTRLCRRSVQKYLRLGRAIRCFPMADRNWLREQLAKAGTDRAISLGRVIESYPTVDAIAPWVDKAATVSARAFRRLMFEAVPAEPGHPSAELCPTCERPWRRKLVP